VLTSVSILFILKQYLNTNLSKQPYATHLRSCPWGLETLHWLISMERRRSARLEINLPCRLSSPRLGSEPLVGITESMSRGDVMVLLSEQCTAGDLLTVGDPLIVEIDLPAKHAFGRKCMQCQTTIVRVSDSESGTARIAMRIHKMRFQSRGRGAAFDDNSEKLVRQLSM
jgi:hypothetical protein